MECNKDEAIRAKEIAENKMIKNDFEGARKIALKAKKLYPELDNISQLLAVCDVHCSAQKKINGTVNDLYGILQVEKSDDDVIIKKQYKKLALVLHPDKNHFPGAEAAFKLICEAHMILSDKGKRYIHDTKCGVPAKPTVSKPAQNHQVNGAQSKSFNVPTPSSQDTFWTFCPFCRNKYEYYRAVVNKTMKCHKCLKIFIASDIGARAPQSTQPNHYSNVNPVRPTTSQQEEVGKQKKVKVDIPKADESSRFANQHPRDAKVGDGAGSSKKVENGNLDAKKRKQGVASIQTASNPSGVSDFNGKNDQKRPRKRTQVSNSEEIKNDPSSQKRSNGKEKEKKKGSAEAKQKDASEPKANVDTVNSMQNDKNGDVNANSDSEDDAEPVYVDVPESEFSNFDSYKEEHCFAVDQVWAVYDTIDCMPRFYAQIKKVYSSAFKLRIMWFEADPENDLEKSWVEQGLPVASGRFRRGDSEETKDRLMFSHRVSSYEKGSKRFTFVIYPKKGDIWALYKDWDINWSSDPENHNKEYKFEIVEVLSDFDNDNGVVVAFMVKVEGFVSVFQKTSRVRLAEHRIPSSELFRFSHQIPSVKLTGNERADVPVGSFELDTASLPADLDQFYVTNNVNVNVNLNPVQNTTFCSRSPERNKVNDFVAEKVIPRRSPRGLKDNCGQSKSNGVENKTNIATPSKGNKDKNVNTKKPELSSSSGGFESMIIHDFNLDRKEQKFEVGQIWGIRASENGNLRCYVQIKKIDGSPSRLHVDSLESCNDAIRPNACGLYKPSGGEKKTVQPEAFLYHVKAQVNGKNRFNIYPREKEIWVLYKKNDLTCAFVDDNDNAGHSDIVEVIEDNNDMIAVLFLSRVPGYKSVYKSLERGEKMPIAQSDRFIGRVPAFLLTEELNGQLRGCWELDLTEFPGGSKWVGLC